MQQSRSISFCVIAAIFLGASIYTMITCSSCSPFLDYEQSLDEKQRTVYHKVVAERQRIYLTGLVLGTLLAFVYLYTNNLGISPFNNSCVFVSISLFTQYIYYILFPKSHNMVTIMNSKTQLEKWHAVYKHMQFRYHGGMVLGLIGYFLLAYGLQ
jgi:uncharacterized protein YacL